MRPDFVIQKEKFIEFYKELDKLFKLHYEESVNDKDGLEYDVDYQRYINLEAAGVFHCLTLRANGELVGYFFFMVVPHLHHKDLTIAASDMLFVHPDYRRYGQATGLALIRKSLKAMKELGVRKVYIPARVGTPLGRVLNFLGFKHIEDNYSCMLG